MEPGGGRGKVIHECEHMWRGEGGYMLNVKWTEMNERGSESKIRSFERTYILNDPKVFSLQVRSMIC